MLNRRGGAVTLTDDSVEGGGCRKVAALSHVGDWANWPLHVGGLRRRQVGLGRDDLGRKAVACWADRRWAKRELGQVKRTRPR